MEAKEGTGLGGGHRLGVETIIAGVDSSGPHVYQVCDPGLLTCCDDVGFCAIGSGGRQFETLFMSASYTRAWPLEHALLLMYSAKKKAEVSPGVGGSTDMFLLGSDSDGPFTDAAIQALEEAYRDLEAAFQRERSAVVQRLLRDGRVFAPPDEGQSTLQQGVATA